MTRITLDITKSVEKNAEVYFNRSKKAKKKLEKTIKALERIKKKKEQIDRTKEQEKEKQTIPQKQEWYEKFHWFISSEGFLVIGGKDATSNEIVIKKHTDPKDIVFHTDISGSPFFVIKTENKIPKEITLKETATATASYSKAWKLGVTTVDVFYVNPDQVTKTTKAGEYMPKGAFMVYGKKNYIKSELQLAIGLKDDKVMAAALSTIKKHTKDYLIIQQGKQKKSAIAKSIQIKLKSHVDDIIRALPTGGCSIKK